METSEPTYPSNICPTCGEPMLGSHYHEMDLSPQERILQEMARQNLTIDSEFVPWSKSRNAKEKSPSLNWKVTLRKGGKAILTTDYSAGCAHAPSYQFRPSVDSAAAVKYECENGRQYAKSKVLEPKPEDVMYSLVLDTSILDSSTYEEWAGELGYDPDSRKGEKLYRECLAIALKIKNGLGNDGLERLKAACEGY